MESYRIESNRILSNVNLLDTQYFFPLDPLDYWELPVEISFSKHAVLWISLKNYSNSIWKIRFLLFTYACSRSCLACSRVFPIWSLPCGSSEDPPDFANLCPSLLFLAKKDELVGTKRKLINADQISCEYCSHFRHAVTRNFFHVSLVQYLIPTSD